MRKALPTGTAGQHGACLAGLLVGKGYEVYGIKRRSPLFNTVESFHRDFHEADVRIRLHCGGLTEATTLIRVIQQIRPDEICNLGAQSHVSVSLEAPEGTANVDAPGRPGILGAIRSGRVCC